MKKNNFDISITTDIKNSYIARASSLNLGSFTHVKSGPERAKLINNISDGYIKATEDKDEDLRDQYISALMLLFWGEVSKMADRCKTVPGYTFVDYISVLYNCIEVAMKYRAWQNPSNHTTAEACIRNTIATRGVAAIIYKSNLDSQKSNACTTSFDTKISDDEKLTLEDVIADDTVNSLEDKMEAELVIQSLLNNRKPIESIILDVILNNDVYRTTKTIRRVTDSSGNTRKVATVNSVLVPLKVAKLISGLPNDYLDSFSRKYNTRDEETVAAFDRLKSSDSAKLQKMIKNTVSLVQRL